MNSGEWAWHVVEVCFVFVRMFANPVEINTLSKCVETRSRLLIASIVRADLFKRRLTGSRSVNGDGSEWQIHRA